MGELWKIKKPILVTPDQLKMMLKEIQLQQHGAGLPGPEFNNYWLNTPGEDVRNKNN